MKKLLLILNPVSGTKKSAKSLTEIISIFNRKGFDTKVFVTDKKGDATDAVKRLSKDVDLIVCTGGDGTLNETVTGIMKNNLNIPLGYIPSGTTNDFASSLKLPTNVLKAAEQITKGTTHSYDVGKFEDRYFCYVASFGAFTKTSYNTPQNIKNALGHISYILEGIQELSSIRKEHIRIEADGEIIEDDFLFGAICNSMTVGGVLTLDPDVVDMADNKFELLLIRAPKDIQELGECILAIKNQKYNCNMITFRSATNIKIFADSEMCWSLDGEKTDGSDCITIENLHQKITFIH